MTNEMQVIDICGQDVYLRNIGGTFAEIMRLNRVHLRYVAREGKDIGDYIRVPVAARFWVR